MFSALALILPLSAVCLAAPTVTEDQLRSLIQPLLDFSHRPEISAKSPPLFSSLAAVSPLDNLVIGVPQTANRAPANQISPANQQMAQLNLGGGLNSVFKTALGSLRPPNSFTQPAPSPMPAQPNNNNNMFNPFSFLFPGLGGANSGPFGMLMPSLMMRMMERLMELF